MKRRGTRENTVFGKNIGSRKDAESLAGKRIVRKKDRSREKKDLDRQREAYRIGNCLVKGGIVEN